MHMYALFETLQTSAVYEMVMWRDCVEFRCVLIFPVSVMSITYFVTNLMWPYILSTWMHGCAHVCYVTSRPCPRGLKIHPGQAWMSMMSLFEQTLCDSDARGVSCTRNALLPWTGKGFLPGAWNKQPGRHVQPPTRQNHPHCLCDAGVHASPSRWYHKLKYSEVLLRWEKITGN